ncbi:porin [Pseudoduganella namucuonensis]|uniref:Outer membrane protein (Porin) n=1 Tax=Pseudoduganella namucuonensis TaxID=1035707 RepID=A0A1I7M6Z5_9BURK|nr:porin [Pseudoduganella namucuonensis]SFV17686.1 Outer membrane protein (porin) [Pseudoduganella namucuonensis]
MKKIVMGGLIAATAVAQNASAVDFKAGDWTVGVGGIVNAYYTQVSCSGDAVGGLALATKGLGCGGQDDRSTIGNGLLPNGLVTSASSRIGGYDVKALIGMYNATATDSAISQNSGIDVRQAYFTFGNAEMGTIKLGRDNGLFGAAAIFGDMTLIGAGAPTQATQRGRVTLGHIGAGYSYVGYYGQIAYSSPKTSGVGVDVALVSPVTDTPILTPSLYSTKTSPQLQGQLTWSAGGAKAWLGAKTQKFESATAGVNDFTMSAVEVGASYNEGALGLLVNVQGGKGLGVLSDADQGETTARNYFVQGTYKATEKLKVGLGYGISKNSDNTAGTGGLKSNANVTLGAYYALNSVITLVGEVGQTRSKGFNGGEARMNGAALGGIIFF